MRVCMFTRVHIWKCTHVCARACACTPVSTPTCVHVLRGCEYLYIHIGTWLHLYVPAFLCVWLRMCVLMFIIRACTQVCARLHVHVWTCVHVCGGVGAELLRSRLSALPMNGSRWNGERWTYLMLTRPDPGHSGADNTEVIT